MREEKKKKALSPVIATVLLVVLVIVSALIIFLWFRGFIGENTTKFGKDKSIVCLEVQFNAAYSPGGTLLFSNDGNIAIYGMYAKIIGSGGSRTINLGENPDWPPSGLNPGGSFSLNIGTEFDSAERVALMPILLGNKGESRETFTCDEKYAYIIELT